ncbi:AMP-binding protein [Shewanella olleyana]|uniref:AMP-binding protein n=1 Tax=Shewanella olleyana TaxID=135626 RepID=UPI00200D888C|nr:AMP-binding protein [Shewanella olleyana]MCL1066168.1 AMP-binding protein [Shewanella olleyana]
MISPLHQTALNSPEATAIQLPTTSHHYAWQNVNETVNNETANNEAVKNQSVSHHTISYLQLSHIVSNLVESLKVQKVSRNSRIACISSNNLEMICLYWACVDIGAIFLPISPRFPASQVAELCQRFEIGYFWSETINVDVTNTELIRDNSTDKTAEPEFAATSQLKLELTDKPFSKKNTLSKPTVDADKPLNIILTSGSSGKPKGVVHCLANHIASASGSAENIPLTLNDSWLLSLPLFHIGGLAIINRCALAGAALVLSSKHALWQQITDADISHVSLVAAQLTEILAQQPQALDKVKALLLGGGAIEPHLVSALADRHINAYCSYGMSEMSSQITTALINPQGHLGKPLNNRQLTIRDGAIWVKGECLFLGYLTQGNTQQLQQQVEHSEQADKQPQEQIPLSKAIDEQGWFNTQDLGEFDADGNLLLLGRTDNMFICGGENIHPEEIEAAIKAHPSVQNAIVFAQEDLKFSLLPAAIIQLKANAQLNGPSTSELDVREPETKTTEAQTSENRLTTFTAADINSIEELVLTKIARFKRPRHYYTWPNDVETTGLKIPRKAIIAAVKQRITKS